MSTSFYATLARYYDSEHHDKDEDLEFYGQIAQDSAGPVFIVGAGTGRLALYLAQNGRHPIYGVELEEAMLARARPKVPAGARWAERAQFFHADAAVFTPPRPCALAIIPYNTFMHFLDHDAQVKLLRNVYAALRPDGILVIDLPNAGEAFAAQDSEAVVLERTFTDQETGHRVMQQSSSALDRVEQIMAVTWIYDEVAADGVLKRTVIPVEIRYFFFHELRLLLSACGFRMEATFGDFDGSLFADGAPRMIAIARKA
jgi:SAM-dependent methyltransferase